MREKRIVADCALRALNNPDALTRVYAACLLGFVGDGRAVRALAPLENDAEPHARQQARLALRRLGAVN